MYKRKDTGKGRAKVRHKRRATKEEIEKRIKTIQREIERRE